MEAKKEKSGFLSQIKYYTTLTLGTTACISSFVFMFMIPWVLDPSISTLMANFDPEPVLCRTVTSDHRWGNINCTWTSCKNGCTKDVYECDQIYVSYMNLAYADYEGQELDFDNESIWVGRGLPLFINIKACGYPPNINCSVFADTYAPEGTVFPCHFSRVDPELVITDYDRDVEVNNIVMALLIPNLLCGICLGIVSYWWYPGCQKKRCQYQIPPDQENASINTGNDDDDGDDAGDDDDDNEDEKDTYTLEDKMSGTKGRTSHDEDKEVDTTISMQEDC